MRMGNAVACLSGLHKLIHFRVGVNANERYQYSLGLYKLWNCDHVNESDLYSLGRDMHRHHQGCFHQ